MNRYTVLHSGISYKHMCVCGESVRLQAFACLLIYVHVHVQQNYSQIESTYDDNRGNILCRFSEINIKYAQQKPAIQ